MAAKEDVPLKTERTVHHSNSSSGKKSQAAQPHVNDDRSSSRASANLTPVFDREDNLKHLDVAYNEASSSEESDYNQASVIFSLDELQNSLTGLQTSISPEIPPLDNKSSAGLLFPTLIQDEDENFSMSSKEDEESDQNSDEFNLSSTSPPVEDYLKNLAKTDVPHDDVPVDNKVTKCSTRKVNSPNTEVQPDIVITSDDSLLYHINSSVAAVDSMAVETVPSDVSSVPATVHPKSLTYTTHIEDSSVVGVALDDTSPQVETPHVETSSDVTITQSTPIETPTATSNKSLSGIELLGETELSNSPTSANPDNSPTSANPDNIFMHEKSTDSISMSGGMASGDGSKSLSEKLKSTPNTFESPALNTFESPGLLYAHPVKKSSKQVVETLEPAEAATEALLAEEKSSVATSQENRHIRAKADKRGKLFIDQMHLPSFNYKQLTGEVYIHINYYVVLVNVTKHITPLKKH